MGGCFSGDSPEVRYTAMLAKLDEVDERIRDPASRAEARLTVAEAAVTRLHDQHVATVRRGGTITPKDMRKLRKLKHEVALARAPVRQMGPALSILAGLRSSIDGQSVNATLIEGMRSISKLAPTAQSDKSFKRLLETYRRDTVKGLDQQVALNNFFSAVNETATEAAHSQADTVRAAEEEEERLQEDLDLMDDEAGMGLEDYCRSLAVEAAGGARQAVGEAARSQWSAEVEPDTTQQYLMPAAPTHAIGSGSGAGPAVPPPSATVKVAAPAPAPVVKRRAGTVASNMFDDIPLA